jgi:hypothetical protein
VKNVDSYMIHVGILMFNYVFRCVPSAGVGTGFVIAGGRVLQANLAVEYATEAQK